MLTVAGACAQTISIAGSGYTLSVLDGGRVAVMEVSSFDYVDATEDGLSASRARSLARRVYNHFDDVFDFLFFVNATPAGTGFPYDVITFAGNNEVRGIGQQRVDRSSLFGSDGKLQSVVHLASPDSFGNGDALRGIARRWANELLPTEVPGRWGYSSAGGVLGGWVDGTLRFDPERGAYVGTGPGGAPWTPDGSGLRNDTQYSLIELYAMGLVSPAAAPPLMVAQDPAPVSGGFTADGFQTWDIDRIVARNGERRPRANESQRAFRGAVVVLAERGRFPPTEQLQQLDAVVEDFADAVPSGSPGVFRLATRGLATLKLDGLREFFTGTGEMAIVSMEVDPPQLHISIQADNGLVYQLESSSDLVDWERLGPARAGLGSPERVTVLGVYSADAPGYLRLRALD